MCIFWLLSWNFFFKLKEKVTSQGKPSRKLFSSSYASSQLGSDSSDKNVIDDENLHKLSFSKTCFTDWTISLWWLYYRRPSLNVSFKHTGAHLPPISQHLSSGLQEMAIFYIFLLFMHHCVVKKLSVQCGLDCFRED